MGRARARAEAYTWTVVRLARRPGMADAVVSVGLVGADGSCVPGYAVGVDGVDRCVGLLQGRREPAQPSD